MTWLSQLRRILLCFLAETLHPEVRPDRLEVESVRAADNRLLRPDRFEIRQIRSVSGKPGRAYVDRKGAEGKTEQEVVRALKRQLSNVV